LHASKVIDDNEPKIRDTNRYHTRQKIKWCTYGVRHVGFVDPQVKLESGGGVIVITFGLFGNVTYSFTRSLKSWL
jgi:hypothetical protein